MVFNRDGRVFVGNRIDYPSDNWQMPQGGIDPGETPRATAMRELEEEIGTSKAEIIAESRVWLCYDLPSAMSRQAWGGQFPWPETALVRIAVYWRGSRYSSGRARGGIQRMALGRCRRVADTYRSV